MRRPGSESSERSRERSAHSGTCLVKLSTISDVCFGCRRAHGFTISMSRAWLSTQALTAAAQNAQFRSLRIALFLRQGLRNIVDGPRALPQLDEQRCPLHGIYGRRIEQDLDASPRRC